ncbi:MAG: hypothetical protein NTY38_15890 [Acidobacteria bacterium]|nr:hypothetical protein [Acidobacteriota bacterium]
MKASRLLLLAVCSSGVFAQTIELGAGAPTESIRQAYISAFYRNGFNQLINPNSPAVGNVKKFGATGLVQEFQDIPKTAAVRYALIKANSAVAPPTNGTFDVFQVHPGLYAYYSTLASATVGFPNADTGACPPVVSNSCTYILLDKNYALFSYTQPLYNGQNFAVRDPFYTKWLGAGAISGIGPANNPEQAYTSPLTATTATYQTFDKGAVYSITSGSLSSRAFLIRQPVYATYVSNGVHSGVLGLPTSDEVLLPTGLRRQSFEGGTIVYDPFSPTAILQLAVASVAVSGASGTVRLNLGDTLALQATPYSSNSVALSGRLVTWTTSDGRVAAVDANGAGATVRAVGGGTARILASSEGRSSAPVTVFVSAPCCAVGEGAPTPAIGQMFVDAVTRNQLAVRLPAASPVTRLAGGFVQRFQSVDPASTALYLVAASDQSSSAYLVAGALLARYEQLGGPAGSLGYPRSDSTATGRQVFAGGTLAGSPIALVSGAFLTKWAALGYETGSAGNPIGDPVPFLTFTGAGGSSQSFIKGLIVSGSTAPYAGKTWFVSGTILSKFIELGGVAGQLGMPLTDEYVTAGRHRQDFEGGSVSWAGGEAPQVAPRDRQPAVNITPSTVVAGNRVRVAVGGFANNATLRVTVSGQADFTVATETGAYAWDFPVAATARSSTITVSATDTATRASASGSFSVRSTADANLHLVKVSGGWKVRMQLQTRTERLPPGCASPGRLASRWPMPRRLTSSSPFPPRRRRLPWHSSPN